MDPYMKRKAFTLIELIIVIVVLGILATIAIVGYRAVIDRANQSSAENAAKSFDRQIRAQAAFGMDGNPNMTDPRRGQLMIDMLQDPAAGGSTIKDLPDADVIPANLTTNSVRVLVWNFGVTVAAPANWTRLCNATGCTATSASVSGTTIGKIPTGSTANSTTATGFCLAFRKGGQTVFLGLSDRANTPGTVSSTLATACGAITSTQPTAGYTLLGGAGAVTTDTSW